MYGDKLLYQKSVRLNNILFNSILFNHIISYHITIVLITILAKMLTILVSYAFDLVAYQID
ncbi:hypothetical protein EGC79_15240 [Shewanella vesiculosa]|nr:hypothetical protein EGC79_15240 [Shewanella vesiculosa]